MIYLFIYLLGADKAAKIGKYHRTHVRENTILSFTTAASLGAEYVEFDVHLTKDRVPGETYLLHKSIKNSNLS